MFLDKTFNLEREGTSSGTYLPGLTGVRGAAACWVLIYHLWVFSGPKEIVWVIGKIRLDFTPLFSCGWVGVDIFFVLSGFLLSLPFIRGSLGLQAPQSAKEFYRRRALRILPLYYFQLFILVSLAKLGVFGVAPTWWDVISHVSLVHHFFEPFSGSINEVFWTLSLEMGFYLILPFFVPFIASPRLGGLLLVSVILVLSYRLAGFALINAYDISSKGWVMEQLPGRIDQFVMGITSAYLFVRFQGALSSVEKRLSTILVVTGLAGIIGMLYLMDIKYEDYWKGDWTLFTWHSITGFFVAQLLFGVALSGALAQKIFNNRMMVFLGIISYSLYLWHFVVIKGVQQLDWVSAHDGYVLPYLTLFCAPLIVAISVVSYWFIERPFLRIRHRNPTPNVG